MIHNDLGWGIVLADNAIAAANNTNQASSIVNMTNFQGAVAISAITSNLNTAVSLMKFQDNTANSGTGMVDVAGNPTPSVTATSGSDHDQEGKYLRLSIYKSQQGWNRPYLRIIRTTATANAAFGELYIILFKENIRPVALDATCLAAIFGGNHV